MKHLSDLVHTVFSYLSMEEEKPWKRSCLCWWRLLSNAFTWCFLSSGINSFLLQGCGYTTSFQWKESHCIVIWFCLLIVAFKEALTWSCGGKPAVLCYGFIPGVMSIVCRRWFDQRGARRCKEGTGICLVFRWEMGCSEEITKRKNGNRVGSKLGNIWAGKHMGLANISRLVNGIYTSPHLKTHIKLSVCLRMEHQVTIQRIIMWCCLTVWECLWNHWNDSLT